MYIISFKLSIKKFVEKIQNEIYVNESHSPSYFRLTTKFCVTSWTQSATDPFTLSNIHPKHVYCLANYIKSLHHMDHITSNVNKAFTGHISAINIAESSISSIQYHWKDI